MTPSPRLRQSPVPPMDHPYGKSWPQPDPEEMLFDSKHVLMIQRHFDQLLDYSRSQPSGVYEGKMWREGGNGKWWLRWFGKSENPGMCSNHVREILIA